MNEQEKNRLSSLSYWFPKISKLGILVPKTIIVSCNHEDIMKAYYGEQEIDMTFIEELMRAANNLKYPIFMRTDLSSGKHNWKNTCYVESIDRLIPNLFLLSEYNEIGRFHYTSIVIREFLQLETSFSAFPGHMPINIERRYFIREGRVICHHPYWPQEAFKDYGYHDLTNLNMESEEEISLLTLLAEKVAAVLPEYWSVDFAKTKQNEWYLIDMAVGEHSYHWKTCENLKSNS